MPISSNYTVSPISASNIVNFPIDVSNIAAQQGGGTGLIYVAVSDNLEGLGIVGDPLKTKDNIQVVSVTATNNITANNVVSSSKVTAVSVTASLKGDGSQVTNINSNNITNFTDNVRNQLSAGTNLTYSSGQFSLRDDVDLSSVTSSFSGNGSQITNITSSNISNFTNDTRAQLSAGSNLTYSSGQFALNDNIALSSVTASLSGNGSQITNITSSNINNFTTDVRNKISGSQYVTYNTSSGVVSLPYTGSIVGETPIVLGSTATIISGLTEISASNITGSLYSNKLRLAPSGVQLISSTTTSIAPTGPFHRVTLNTNITLSTSIPQIVWPAAAAGDLLIIYNVPSSTGDLTLNRGAITKLALAGATVKLSQGGTVTFIYDGTNWVEIGVIAGTSTP